MADLKEFTYSDVSEHSTKKDLYIVVHDKVYNASSFVDEHPYVSLFFCLRMLDLLCPSSLGFYYAGVDAVGVVVYVATPRACAAESHYILRGGDGEVYREGDALCIKS